MAATPTVLTVNNNDQYLSASTDETSSHGILTSGENVFTWNYNSVDSIPTTIQLPGIPSNYGFPPLALLTAPSAGSSVPGIVSINTHSGHVRFYENVDTISSIGLLQQHKGIENLIKLHDKEFITIAENIEPAGVLLATSQGRVILLCLRDFAGRPYIRSTDIIKRQTGFFSSALDRSRHVVSIKAGTILGQGERVAVLTSRNGQFQIWSCSSDGQARKILHHELIHLLTDSIAELYPNAVNRLEVLDLALLSNFDKDDVFLLLTSFENSLNETFYVLFTIKKEGDQLLIFSAYKLNTYTLPYVDQPRLYVPSPGSIAFIIFDHSVVLTELVTKLDHTLNLKRKWEDVLTFRSDVKIIGSGFENLKRDQDRDLITQSPSAVIVIPQIGVIKIEALESTDDTESVPSTPVSFLKSHIEQAVFYGEDSHNPIEFDLPESLNISQNDIETDLTLVAEEILLSKSTYLPPRLSSILDHLKLRKQKLEKLLAFAITNFKHKVSHQLFLHLLAILQEITAALSLEEYFSKASGEEEKVLLSIFAESLKDLSLTSGSSSNATEFFSSGLNNLNKLLAKFFKRLNDSKDLQAIPAQMVTHVFSPVLQLEKSFRYDVLELSSSEFGNDQLWFTQDDILFTINHIFHHFSTISLDNSQELTETAIQLAELLFYQTQQVLIFWESQTPKTRAIQDTISTYELFYQDNSSFWTRTLVLFNAKNAALAIAETYKDLKSLAEISDEDLESSSTEEERESVQLRFSHYFKKFGYEFASTLYNYYISVEKYQSLLLGFQEYSYHLRRFFAENDHSKISWIKDIFDDDFKKAAEVLLNYSQKNSDSQRDKRLKLNISKLAALASILDIEKVDHSTENLLGEIQEELDFSEAQSSILEQISQFISADNDPIAQVDLVTRDLLNSKYNNSSFTIIKKSFERALGRLLTNKTLSVNEIIDIFTLLDGSKTGNSLNFFYALKVLHLSNLSEAEKLTNAKLIWKRAILSDDWATIIESENRSNEYIKTLIENTFTFKTLLNYFQDGLYTLNNDYKIPLPNITQLSEIDNDAQLLLRFKFIGGMELHELRDELQQENALASEIFGKPESDQLIKGLIGTANEKSTANKVINYTQLTIED
jgi:nuclear pore complex protein Nup133